VLRDGWALAVEETLVGEPDSEVYTTIPAAGQTWGRLDSGIRLMVTLKRFTSLLFASSQSYTGCHQPSLNTNCLSATIAVAVTVQ